MSNLKPNRYRRGLWVAAGTAGIAIVLGIVLLVPSVFGQATTKTATQGNAGEQNLLSSVQSIYRFIKQNYVEEVADQTLLDGALKGMFEALKDPHTAYLLSEETRSLNDVTSGEFAGIGAYIDKQRDAEGATINNGYIEIVSPIDDTPAQRAGLVAGDLIVEVDGASTDAMTSDEATSHIRGAVGSTVELRIFRGKSMDFKVKIKRDNIEIPTVKYTMIGDVAYVRLIQFTPKITERMKAALQDLAKKKYKSLILDLRNNPGGVLPSAVEIADLFFSDGVLVSTKGRVKGENHVYNASSGTEVDPQAPMIVLVNGGSASASEILAGALKDRGRAILVGEKSYGKGSVQTVVPLSEDREFRLTIAKYYTPAGITIDKIGIYPDVEVKEITLNRDEELAYIHLREQDLVAKFVDGSYVPDSKVPAVKDSSPTAAQIDAFVKGLVAKNIVLNESLVRQLVKNEVNRKANVSPIVDTDFDLTLKKALDILQKGQVADILKKRPAPSATGLPAPNTKP